MILVHINNIIVMKKKHPCGGNRFVVTDVGPDITLQCEKCGHVVKIPRMKLDKSIKSVETNDNV